MKFTVTQIANAVGVSGFTLKRWYNWYEDPTQEKPEGMPPLPKCEKVTHRNIRLWEEEAIPALIAFKNWVPKGCKGLMRDYTKKYQAKTFKEELACRTQHRGQ